MRINNKYYGVFLALFCVLGVAQCGGKGGLSSQVRFKAVPSRPVVILADLIVNPGELDEETFRGPWFRSGASITNGSNKSAYIVNIMYKVTSIKSGVPSTGTSSLNVGTACNTDPNPRVYVAILSPGQVYEGMSNPCDPSSADTAVNVGSYEYSIIDGLAESDSAFYTIEAEAVGWFADVNGVPIERLSVIENFSTQ